MAALTCLLTLGKPVAMWAALWNGSVQLTDTKNLSLLAVVGVSLGAGPPVESGDECSPSWYLDYSFVIELIQRNPAKTHPDS